MNAKVTIVSEYDGELDFFFTPVRCPDCGEEHHIRLGFGIDGTMWIDPRHLGIGPQDVEQLEKFGDTYLLMNPKRCEVLINAKAVVMVRTDPAWCRKWLSFVEDMLRRHKAVRAQAAAAMKARNN